MPLPETDLLVAPAVPPIRVGLEPAHNVLNSLLLLNRADDVSGLFGLDEWVTRTAAALTPEQRRTNYLVLIGLHYAILPDRSWPSFPAYVAHLATLDPVTLRDRVFNAYAQVCKGDECHALPDPTRDQATVDIAPLLDSVDAFLDFLRARFPVKSIDVEVETEAHRYLNDPPAMQSLILSHFNIMWEEVLAPEWNRVLPMLQASVEAFQQLDLAKGTKLEAAQRVVGRDMEDDEYWKTALDGVGRLVFVPSMHVGPYLGKMRAGDTLWILFGARIPDGVTITAPDLSRAEILVRLSALADDTRLRILKVITEEGEQCSQDIMAQLDLSQSAASRHLKQLSATGYLSERRCEGAKCYTLNPQRIEDTLRAISAFLLGGS